MSKDNIIHRRTFLKTMPVVLGGVGSFARFASAEDGSVVRHATVQEVIDFILKDAGVDPIQETIDTIKTGSPDQVVQGIVTTFMATNDVIQQAVKLGANFIITHEPTFYSHRDTTDWLKDDPVYRHKRALLDDHKIAVWRYHDHIHKIDPDPFSIGLIERLGWRQYIDPDDARYCHLPKTTLLALAQHCKDKLGMASMRYVGDPEMPCQSVGILPGAWGGKTQIELLGEGKADVLICGEVNEWETNEYVRDSQQTLRPHGLIVTGHVCSEEDGMRGLGRWLSGQLPHIPTHHVPAGDPFAYL